MIARRYGVTLCGLLCWLTATLAQAQDQHVSCSVALAPAMEFGQPVANPTGRVDSTARVTVTCTGNESVNNTPIKVCLLAAPDPQRALRSGASPLRYELYGDGGYSQPLRDSAPYLSMQVMLDDTPHVTAEAAFTLYGRIGAGQVGLAGGVHTDAVPLQARASVNLGNPCSAMPLKATTSLQARAQLASGSCSVVADDLRFGTAYSLGGAIDARTALGVTCTAGTPYAVSLSGGSTANDSRNRRMGSLGQAGPDGVRYQLYSDSGRARPWGDEAGRRVEGVGTGTPLTHPVFGRVPAQPTPPPGVYQDTVTATVSY